MACECSPEHVTITWAIKQSDATILGSRKDCGGSDWELWWWMGPRGNPFSTVRVGNSHWLVDWILLEWQRFCVSLRHRVWGSSSYWKSGVAEEEVIESFRTEVRCWVDLSSFPSTSQPQTGEIAGDQSQRMGLPYPKCTVLGLIQVKGIACASWSCNHLRRHHASLA